MLFENLKNTDPEIFEAIQKEIERERRNIVLIASENYVSPAVLARCLARCHHITALILAALILVGLFLKYTSLSSALQASGAFTVLLVGFYYVAQIFLLGAVCCRVYADLYGSRRPTAE